MNKLLNSSLSMLKEKRIPNPELDLRILLRHAAKTNKDIILSNFESKDIDIDYFNSLILKRLNNEPISKIIKKKFFWKHEFFVNSNVLDPRPDTELIIEEVLNNVKNRNKKLKILDIGTGSGCIAISLAKELKNSEVMAIDISKRALKVAEKNIKFYNLNNQIDLRLSKFEKIKNKFDIIVSNPPYVSENEYKNLGLEIRNFEPKLALVGGKDGLKFYRFFAKKIEKIMKNNSFFICEIGDNQSLLCQKIFKNSKLILKKVSKDIQKIDRTLTFLKI